MEQTYIPSLMAACKRMQTSIGTPQYYEYVLHQDKRYIVQIADVHEKEDHIEFMTDGTQIIEGHSVMGSMDEYVSTLVVCTTMKDIENLVACKELTRYILCINPDLVSSHAFFKHESTFRLLSEPRVIIGLENMIPGRLLIDHLRNLWDMTGKVSAVLTKESTVDYGLPRDDRYSFPVCHGKFRVIASEKQNRLLVLLPEAVGGEDKTGA